MEYRSKFNISISGLPVTGQQFEYELGEEFFAYFNHPDLKKGKLKANIEMNRIEKSYAIDMAISGLVEISCDRCLGSYNFPVEVKHQLYARNEADCSETDLEDDDIIVIKQGEHVINMAQHLHDFISLTLPYRKVHPDDESGTSTCDPEFLKRISKEEFHKPTGTDPRWDILKNLKNN
ncbi:MAG: DUF177 domain-containing protein [Bacteroidia bacterium]|nr:DUF177 domain-containing protein [Bacteroidia bacterium]